MPVGNGFASRPSLTVPWRENSGPTTPPSAVERRRDTKRSKPSRPVGCRLDSTERQAALRPSAVRRSPATPGCPVRRSVRSTSSAVCRCPDASANWPPGTLASCVQVGTGEICVCKVRFDARLSAPRRARGPGLPKLVAAGPAWSLTVRVPHAFFDNRPDFCTPAPLRAEPYALPIASPLLAPDKRALAGWTDLCRQIRLLVRHDFTRSGCFEL